jgi:tetratricopeptide (TPR) repeat protein
MAEHTDERGLALTTESAEAVAAFDETIRSNLEYRLGTAKSLKQVLATDPDFVMGQCLKGYLLTLFGSTAYDEAIRDCLEFCEGRLDGLTPRETAHVAALKVLARGDLRQADLIWNGILVEHPRDLLALRLQHFALFYMGDGPGLRDAIARVLPAWNEAVPGYGFVLGMRAFGLEESGDYGAAEAAGRRATELNPDDLWAIHAVAHVLEMQGRCKEGLAWLAQPLDIWDDRNAFKEHLWWHRALYHHETGGYDAVLELYDTAVRRDKESDFYLNLVNCAALLWRLVFQGVEVSERWDELAEMCEARIEDHVLIFSDLHFCMALAGAGRIGAIERQLDSLEDFGDLPDNTAAATVAPVALPLCRAIKAFAEGEHDEAVALMLPIRRDTACLGGSHAQRDIFSQFLIEAALKAGQHKLARALLAERVALKPSSAGSWRKYAEVLETLGDLHGAAEASRRFDKVMMA